MYCMISGSSARADIAVWISCGIGTEWVETGLVEYALIVRLTIKSINLSTHEAVVYDTPQTRCSHATRIQTRVIILLVEDIEGTIQCYSIILSAQ